MMKRSNVTNFSLAAALFLGISGTDAFAKENVGGAGNSNKGAAATSTAAPSMGGGGGADGFGVLPYDDSSALE